MRVRLAATSAAATGGRRPEATVVRLPAARGRARREGHEALELGTRAVGAGYLLLASDQLLEMSTATGAEVVVDRHGKRFAEGWPRVKGRVRSAEHSPPTSVAPPPHRGTSATKPLAGYAQNIFPLPTLPRETMRDRCWFRRPPRRWHRTCEQAQVRPQELPCSRPASW